MDTILIANEVIDSRLKNLKGGIIYKRDIEKAYDYVNWGFLFAIMEKRRFGAKWVS